MTTDQHVDVADLVPEWQRELVHVDYRDQLSPEQVEVILHGGWDDSVDEWVSEAAWDNAWELAGDLLERNPGLLMDQADLAAEIQDLDTSNPYRDLLSNTGMMLFRFSPDEDGMAWLDEELDDPRAALEALGLDEQFLPIVERILPEVAGCRAEGGGWFGATFVFSANPADLAWQERVTIHDPFLWFTNPYSGNGWGEVAEGCTVTFDVLDIHVDKFAWGYGANDVFGGLILPDSKVEPTPKEVA